MTRATLRRLRRGVVSALQWGLTAHLILLAVSGLLIPVLSGPYNLALLYGGTALAFSYGYGRTDPGDDPETRRDHSARVEYLVALVLTAIFLVYGLVPLLRRVGLESAFDVYITTSLSLGALLLLLTPLAIAYAAVYVADIRLYADYLSRA
jgi:hypothetical protein